MSLSQNYRHFLNTIEHVTASPISDQDAYKLNEKGGECTLIRTGYPLEGMQQRIVTLEPIFTFKLNIVSKRTGAMNNLVVICSKNTETLIQVCFRKN